MSESVMALRAISDWHREQLCRFADGLAVAVAVSLPWSTSATGILVVLWLFAVIATLDSAGLKKVLTSPAGGLPVLLVLLSAAGMLWSNVPWAERIDGFAALVKLLAVPLLIAQFRRSDRGQWVLWGFFASCALLLVLSWMLVLPPPFSATIFWQQKQPGIPVKDYISQSGVFTICVFGILERALVSWRAEYKVRTAVLALLALLFLLNILYVATSRTTLVVIPILLILFGVLRLSWKQLLLALVTAATLSGVAWMSSPYLRYRVTHLIEEVQERNDPTAEASAAYRIGFWSMSLRVIREAPLIGHGTGSIAASFRQQGSESAVNPHNQIFAVGIQLGLVGIVILIAMWAAHWGLFFVSSEAGWIGLVIVTQNVVSSFFNSHLADFGQGWVYVFGVGIAAGTVFRSEHKDVSARLKSDPVVAQ